MKSILTHHNYNRPFKVEVGRRIARIFKSKAPSKLNTHAFHDRPAKEITDIARVWLGRGSVILERASGDFVFVGYKVISFRLTDDERPRKFISEMGNNDVVYPALVTDQNIYLFPYDNVVIPIDKAGGRSQDPYEMYYKHLESGDWKPGRDFTKLKYRKLIR